MEVVSQKHVNILKSSVFLCMLFYSLQSQGQEVESKEFKKVKFKENKVSIVPKQLNFINSQNSSVPENTVYFINNRVIPNERLKLISKDSILSVKVIKRDTVINGFEFDAQIFVKTKISN